MLVIGLTGGIASGKTLASDTFAALGVPVVDADLIAREVVKIGSVGLNELIAHFGHSITHSDGALNRAQLREIIFGDEQERKFVDELLHPLIRARSEELIESAAKDEKTYAIYVVPLLVETNQQERFDRILVIDVPRATQLQRLLARDGTDESQANAILDAQATRDERLAVADDVLVNDGDADALIAGVRELHEDYLRLSA